MSNLVFRPSGSWHNSRARRPDRKARGARIPGVSERRATPRAGMPRAGIMSRTTGTGHKQRFSKHPRVTHRPPPRLHLAGDVLLGHEPPVTAVGAGGAV